MVSNDGRAVARNVVREEQIQPGKLGRVILEGHRQSCKWQAGKGHEANLHRHKRRVRSAPSLPPRLRPTVVTCIEKRAVDTPASDPGPGNACPLELWAASARPQRGLAARSSAAWGVFARGQSRR